LKDDLGLLAVSLFEVWAKRHFRHAHTLSHANLLYKRLGYETIESVMPKKNKPDLPPDVTEYMASLGRKGGASKSEAKVKAARLNSEKMLEARWKGKKYRGKIAKRRESK
jgi:hypothetical protein